MHFWYVLVRARAFVDIILLGQEIRRLTAPFPAVKHMLSSGQPGHSGHNRTALWWQTRQLFIEKFLVPCDTGAAGQRLGSTAIQTQ